MNRKHSFLRLASHPWFSRIYARLNPKGHKLALEFIEKHNGANHNEFIHHVNRMFLDKEKPPQWELILDLLTAASVAENEKRV